VGVSAAAVAKVPGENLRVSRAEFGALWSLVEHLASQPPGPNNEYLIGVLRTCRWLADQTAAQSRLDGCGLRIAGPGAVAVLAAGARPSHAFKPGRDGGQRAVERGNCSCPADRPYRAT
jgi:hypothetical protein